MEVDVAVLGGGPGGYTAAIRAAQLGARVACIEREPELGGTCLRIGCIPTKAWVQTAFALKQAEETFGKLGVRLDGPKFEFPVANEWKAAAVKRMTRGVAFLFKANGVQWIRGTGTFTDANTLTVDGGQEVNFKSAIIATGSFPLRPPIPGLDSDRCVDSEQLLAQTEVPARLVILGGGVIGCEFASIFQPVRQRGHDHRDAPVPDPARGRGRVERARQAVPQARHHAASRPAMHQGRRLRIGAHRPFRRRPDRRGGPDARLRRPRAAGRRARPGTTGVEFDRRTGIATDERRRTTVPHIYAVGDCAGYWQLAHTAFREGEVAAQNACGHDATVGNRAVPRPIYTDPEIASVGLTEAQAREQHGDDVATGTFPWIANARAVMQNETAGWVKSIHATRGGELLGLVMIGPHVTDMIEAGVVAIDSNAAVETVADGMAPHPTLSEAIKDAALVALGRAIDVPNRKADPRPASMTNTT